MVTRFQFRLSGLIAIVDSIQLNRSVKVVDGLEVIVYRMRGVEVRLRSIPGDMKTLVMPVPWSKPESIATVQ